MATPLLQVTTGTLQLSSTNAQVLTFQINNTATPPVGENISSGWTAVCICSPNSPAGDYAGTDIGTLGTWAYGSTGC